MVEVAKVVIVASAITAFVERGHAAANLVVVSLVRVVTAVVIFVAQVAALVVILVVVLIAVVVAVM